MNAEAKARAALLLKEEITPEDATRKWYYISIRVTGGEFHGCFIRAFGPTDAWRLMHQLCIYNHDTDQDTSTMGPIEEENMKIVPEHKRWRRVTKADVDKFGK